MRRSISVGPRATGRSLPARPGSARPERCEVRYPLAGGLVDPTADPLADDQTRSAMAHQPGAFIEIDQHQGVGHQGPPGIGRRAPHLGDGGHRAGAGAVVPAQIGAAAGRAGVSGQTLGLGSVGRLKGDATFQAANAASLNQIITNGFTLSFDSGGKESGYNGPISGTGTVQIIQGDAALVLGGTEPNTMTGGWRVKSGRLTLAKEPGVDAALGTIVVGGQGGNDCLYWTNSDQVNDSASVELLDSPKGGATLNLNGCNEKFASLKMAAPPPATRCC